MIVAGFLKSLLSITISEVETIEVKDKISRGYYPRRRLKNAKKILFRTTLAPHTKIMKRSNFNHNKKTHKPNY